jgi:uncharacterized DUF497 family protein
MIMTAKPLVLTAHAVIRLEERHIPMEWVEDTARNPDWSGPDRYDPEVERRFRAIPACGHRVLRVACVETDTAIRVISVLFDRKARRPS